jgi:hypothetical protein
VSNNEKDWEVIDTKNEESAMNQKNFTKRFTIDIPRETQCICFNPRDHSISPNYGTDLSAFELFGTLIQSNNERVTLIAFLTLLSTTNTAEE